MEISYVFHRHALAKSSRDGGENTRLPPLWHVFDSRSRCHMWIEFIVGSLPPSSKTNISKFQYDLGVWRATGLSVLLLCIPPVLTNYKFMFKR